MPSRKRNMETLRALCAQVHSDDGVDPKYEKKRSANRIGVCSRKLRQLCRQVAHALQLVLPDALSDCDATLMSVEPAPNAGRLRVVVAVSQACDPTQVAERLKRLRGHLRSEVAQAVSRRRVPELTFTVVLKTDAV